MPATTKHLFRRCPGCGADTHIRCISCRSCGGCLRQKSHRRGRRSGTGKAAGFHVTTGRPSGTTLSAGYQVGQSGGRLGGTTKASGYGVGQNGGRPTGTTVTSGCEVGRNGRRPTGTTATSGCEVGRNSGRPTGTTATSGCEVGRNGGRPVGTTSTAGANVSKGRPSEMDNLANLCITDTDLPNSVWKCENVVNVTDQVVSIYAKRIHQAQYFDTKPLAKCICWQCGKVVCSKNGFSLINVPAGKSTSDAPANAFLKSVGNDTLSFQTEDRDDNPKWYACNLCKTSKDILASYYVGDVIDKDGGLKPIPLWDMSKPTCLQSLKNVYERSQISLCTIFCTTVKDASFSQWRRVQGEVNTTHKLDRHYYGIFGFLAVKDDDINVFSDNPDSSSRIKSALKWLKFNNHLYRSFYTEFETLFRYVKPQFVNPGLLEKAGISIEKLLEEEAVGMTFPVDAKFFDQFPLIYDGADLAGRQNPTPH